MKNDDVSVIRVEISEEVAKSPGHRSGREGHVN
jgi:hypothetical protein